LLSDTDREVGVAYKAADNHEAGTARRIAYVIEGGKITHAYDVRDVAGHAAAVLADIS